MSNAETWIPESATNAGLYAVNPNIAAPFNPFSEDVRAFLAKNINTTMDKRHALTFPTEEACKAWCDANTKHRFTPTLRG